MSIKHFLLTILVLLSIQLYGKKSLAAVDSITQPHVLMKIYTACTAEDAGLISRVAFHNNEVKVDEVFLHNVSLTPEGNLTEQSLKQFLRQAFKQKVLPVTSFSNLDCIEVKDLSSKKGLHTAQLFSAHVQCGSENGAHYIIKETTSGKYELNQLGRLSSTREIQELIFPREHHNYPTIIVPLAYLSYSHNGRVRFIVIMPAAPGKQLSEFLTDFENNGTQDSALRVSKAYHVLGTCLGNFHRRFVHHYSKEVLNDTVLHGDLHHFNIFYDESTSKITLIDNNRILRYFFQPDDPFKDILHVFMLSPALSHIKVSFQEWLMISLKPFLRGYISVFPRHQHFRLVKELKSKFLNTNSYASFFNNRWVNNRRLPSFKKSGVGILNQLAKVL